MRIVSGLSALGNTAEMVDDLTEQLRRGMNGATVDLLVVFVTSALGPVMDVVVRHLREKLRPRLLLGCTAEGVLGGPGDVVDGREIERLPGAAALAMSLPGVTVDGFHFADDEWPELLGEAGTLRNRLEAGVDLRAFIMFGDPFTTPIVQLLQACSKEFPAAPVVGGMASGAQSPGEVRLAMDDEIFTSGLVGVSLAGNIQIDCVVAQGCKPIGETFVITKAHRNIIEELNGQPSLSAIETMISALTHEDRELLETHGLQVGKVIDEGKGFYGKGDFLIRSLVQVDREKGSIAIGDLARAGQTLQFHVRDAKSADEDLRLVLEGELMLAKAPAGALAFPCTGRGTRLFNEPNHDIRTMLEVLGSVPTAGIFCSGEFGPVGQKSFIHSQSVILALFREAEV